jgi:hypothetical protein
MADTLSEDERAAIAAYDGPITRVAQGATGIDHFEWDQSAAWRRMLRRRRFEAAEVQARIVALAREGATLAEIARAVGLAPGTVAERLRRAGVGVGDGVAGSGGGSDGGVI